MSVEAYLVDSASAALQAAQGVVKDALGIKVNGSGKA